MTLEPNTVEPGYLRRWTKEALAMWGQNWVCWLLVVFVPVAPTFFFGDGMASTIALFIVGVFAVNASFEMAVTAEHRRVQLRHLPRLLKAALEISADDVWRRRVQLLFLMCFGALVGWLLQSTKGPDTPAPTVDLTWVDYLFGVHSPFFRAALMLYFGFVGLRFGEAMGYCSYPLRRMHDIDEDVAAPLLSKAKRKNVGPVVALDGLTTLGAMLVMLFVPVLAIPLLCFLPAFTYFACREIFGPGGPTEVVEEQDSIAVAGA